MQLLLTSDGLVNDKVIEEFLAMLPKPIEEVKILYMYTMQKPEHMIYVEEGKKELTDLGVKEKNIILANISEDIDAVDFNDFDVFYSCGGNTYYILDRIRRTGFDEVIRDFVESGGFYLGVSAGSMILAPSIDICDLETEDEGEFNNVGIKDLSGLSFIDNYLWPHYEKSWEDRLDEFEKVVKYHVLRLRDGEALVIKGEKKYII